MFNIDEELKKLPKTPGVYLMKDRSGVVIYVGKARILKNRVPQYFREKNNHTQKIKKLVENIDSFEYIITDSELEALILENNLIKEYSPKYNTMLKDDKTYPYIKLTVGEPFPRLYSTRIMRRDGAKYFGPYTGAKAVKETIELLRRIFKLRSCKKPLKDRGNNYRTCLYYHIKQCDAPCIDRVTTKEYGENVNRVLKFLGGDTQFILKELTREMWEHSDKLEYEQAGTCKRLIDSVKHISERQKITSNNSQEDRDIIALAREDNRVVVQVFFVRDGKLIGREHFYMGNIMDTNNSELLVSFIKQYYATAPFVPKEVVIDAVVIDEEILLIEKWLSNRRNEKVKIFTPKSGQSLKLLELAKKNAKLVLSIDKERMDNEERRTKGAVIELSEVLGFEPYKHKDVMTLNRIEAFDISHISGQDAVGAMVVYEGGYPKKSEYRKYRIKSNINAGDDYGAMREVLFRRLSRGKSELEYELENNIVNEQDIGSGFSILPNLILMDGGKGQVNIALKVLKELDLDIPVCGMVKNNKHETRGLYFNNRELDLSKAREVLNFVTNIQDEVHRFAITYHRRLRSRNQTGSILDSISGIGEKRKSKLLLEFGSVEAIAEASLEDLKAIAYIDSKTAENIFNYFHNGDSSYGVIELE